MDINRAVREAFPLDTPKALKRLSVHIFVHFTYDSVRVVGEVDFNKSLFEGIRTIRTQNYNSSINSRKKI